MAKEAVKKDEAQNEKLTLEQKFGKIEEILALLENPDVSLEQSFKLYTDGVTLVKECNDDIVGIEEKVKLLSDSGETSDFQ